MGKILDAHQQLIKEAEEKQLITDRVNILEKYASYAEEMLQKEFPKNYTKADVVELADQMIQHDLAVEEQEAKTAELQEKVAEFDELGRVMARGYWNELVKLNEGTGK